MTGALWSGRFEKPPAKAAAEFTSSLKVDRRLWPQEIAVARAHASALRAAQILTADEEGQINKILDDSMRLFESDKFEFRESDEDIHSALERHLTSRLGPAGAKIHAGRSRNDLVATCTRLWLKGAIVEICEGLSALSEALVRQAHDHSSAIMPGYTHLQRAQPITLGHQLLAHVFALNRDFERMMTAHRSSDVSPLGAGALAGTTLPLPPEGRAQTLGFKKVFDNSLDAVSDRDFALDFLSAAATAGVHLSRLGEEIVLWTSSEFRFATLADEYSTGSSIMPQKRNPDVAELVRAKSARLTSNLMRLLVMLKGLPLTYNRDLQEDKEAVFDSADTLALMLPAMTGAISTITFHKDAMSSSLHTGDTSATDLAEALVLRGVPFREAHEAVGKLVLSVQSQGKTLNTATAEDFENAHSEMTEDMLPLLDAVGSIERRASHGGPSSGSVHLQLAKVEAILDSQRVWTERARD